MKLKIPSLAGKWHDPDEVLLHAAFACLENHVAACGGKLERITFGNGISFSEMSSIVCQNVQTEEIKCLYAWWQERKLCQDYPPNPIQWDKDTYMLQRLIAVRETLWT